MPSYRAAAEFRDLFCGGERLDIAPAADVIVNLSR
jgi:hypothetical protein